MIPHIPRTGGTTLKEICEGIFGLSRTLVDVHRHDAPDDLERFEVVEGHKIVSFFDRSFGSAWRRNGFVMLREPVGRVVSAARRIRRDGSTPMHAMLAHEVREPEVLFERFPQLCNLQTKYLAGRLMERSIEASDVDDAMSLLGGMAFGLTEEFDVSMTLLAERFGLPLPRFGKSYATPGGPGDEDLRSEAFRATAALHNEWDRQLYERATHLFEERVGTYVERLLRLDLESGRLDARLAPGAALDDGEPEEDVDEVRLAHDVTSARIGGWMLVDGHVPDAVLATTESGPVTPLCGRIHQRHEGSTTRPVGQPCSGFVGRIEVPLDADAVTLVAFDRRHRVRAERTVPVHRRERPTSGRNP